MSVKIKLTILTIIMSNSMSSAQKLWNYQSEAIGDIDATFAVVLPKNYHPDQKLPLLLALPPGGQNKFMVDLGLEDYWAQQAYNRGWIVISPIRPGRPYVTGEYIPDLLKHITEKYSVDSHEIHLAGNSNGGQSAFRVLEKYPELFKSITVLAGYSRNIKSLRHAKDMKFNLFVGERDYGWNEPMNIMKDYLLSIGANVNWNVIKKEGHEIHALKNHPMIFDAIEISNR